jgi:ATP/maltotriose-dependent transcriptional regulator MalT
MESALARLVNDLVMREAADFALVLDDYHVDVVRRSIRP